MMEYEKQGNFVGLWVAFWGMLAFVFMFAGFLFMRAEKLMIEVSEPAQVNRRVEAENGSERQISRQVRYFDIEHGITEPWDLQPAMGYRYYQPTYTPDNPLKLELRRLQVKPKTKVSQPTNNLGISMSRLHAAVNEARTSRGLGELALDSTLQASAKAKCADMQEHNYWAHSRPDKSWTEFVTVRPGQTVSENLARGFTSPYDTVRGWLNSKPHREVLVGSRYTKVGYATCPGAINNLVVQHISD